MKVLPGERHMVIDGRRWICRYRDAAHPHGEERMCFQPDHEPHTIYVVLETMPRQMTATFYRVKLFSSPGKGAIVIDDYASWDDAMAAQEDLMRQAESLVMEHML